MAAPVASGGKLSISAGEWNKLRADARRVIQDQGRTGPAISLPRSTDCLAVRNDSNSARALFDVVAFNSHVATATRGLLITPDDNLPEFKGRPVLKAYKPCTDRIDGKNDIGRFGILLQPLKSGAIGLAQISGATVCKINVEDEGHLYADVKIHESDELLSREVGAAEILWKEAGTGTGKWAIVRLGQFIAPPLIGMLTTDSDAADPLVVEVAYLVGSTPYGTGRMVDAHLNCQAIKAPYTSNILPDGTPVVLRYERETDQFNIVAPFGAYYPLTGFDPTA